LDAFDEDSVQCAVDYLVEAGALEEVGVVYTGELSPAEGRRFQSQIAFFSNFVYPGGSLRRQTFEDAVHIGHEYQVRMKRAHAAIFGLSRIGSQLIRALVLAGLGKVTAVDSGTVGDAEVYSDAWFTSEQEGITRREAAYHLAAAVDPSVEVATAAYPSDSAGFSALLADVDFAVLCPDYYNPAEYDTFNQSALATKVPWTSARVSGFEFHIGPTIIPFETPCYKCYDLRQKSNLPDFAEYEVVEEFLKSGRLRATALAICPGAGLLALEVLKAITWFTAPATCAHLYSLSLLTMESKLHPVLKVPRCPACSRTVTRPTIHAWQQSRIEGLS
jgi:bacteriocin biosynthesis cyclodehydratase domain-containing protein